MLPACEFCGKAVDIGREDYYHAISGWERPRKGGGANQITLRTVESKVAHAGCVKTRAASRVYATERIF